MEERDGADDDGGDEDGGTQQLAHADQHHLLLECGAVSGWLVLRTHRAPRSQFQPSQPKAQPKPSKSPARAANKTRKNTDLRVVGGEGGDAGENVGRAVPQRQEGDPGHVVRQLELRM